MPKTRENIIKNPNQPIKQFTAQLRGEFRHKTHSGGDGED